jgi:plastocyanin
MERNSHSTRRTFVKALGALGATFGVAGTGTAQEEVVETIELTGYTGGWEGVSPESIAGVENPTIRFEEVGSRYRVKWTNGDGLGHNFVIRNEAGDNLVSTDFLNSEGDSTSVEFEATEEMVRYLCEPHSSSMNGDIALGPASQYEDFASEVDIGLEATSDGWVGLAPSEIEGETNPTIQMTEGEEYDIGIARSVSRDDLSLSIVDEDGNTIESTQVLNDHGPTHTITVEATTEMVGYLADAEPETFSGNIEVEPTTNDREMAIQELTQQADYVFDGLTPGWEGLAPSSIEGETNPTVELEAGETYVFGFINGDGAQHNIAIWDDNDEELSASEYISEENTTKTLEFEATAEAASYVCDIHPTTMIGDLQVPGGGGDGGSSDGGSADDGGSSDGGSADDGGSSDGGSADDGGSSDGGSADDGGSSDGGSADDNGVGFGIVTTLTAMGVGAAGAAKRLLGNDPES